jgi:hypothetical protein
MRAEIRDHLPKKRREGIIVKELPDEVLVYDLDRDKAHCLNHSAAAVWERCDGRTTVADIARAVEKKTGVKVGEEFVWLAIEALGRDHLLEERMQWPAALPRMTRREAVRRIGIGAAIAIPLVTSIIAPTPAQAATCTARCGSCSTGAQCCSGVCATGVSGCTSGMRCT